MIIEKKLLLIFLSLSCSIYSQKLENIIPPSPSASSLARYSEVPVNLYTGIPNIVVPLYNVKSGEIELPISISYHAGGIKVSQEASSVGLGWSLNAGGVITRSIVGKDDLKPNGYVFLETPPHTESGILKETSYNIWKDYISHFWDPHPDTFHYNFLGQSGKLILEKIDSDLRSRKLIGIPLKQNNMKFIYDLDTMQWEITDEKGWTYIFSHKEKTLSVSDSDYFPNNGNSRYFLFDVNRMDMNVSNVPQLSNAVNRQQKVD